MIEILEQFSKENINCTVTLRFQPTHSDEGLRTYYVLDILYHGSDKHWAIIKAGSFDLVTAIRDLMEAWDNREKQS